MGSLLPDFPITTPVSPGGGVPPGLLFQDTFNRAVLDGIADVGGSYTRVYVDSGRAVVAMAPGGGALFSLDSPALWGNSGLMIDRFPNAPARLTVRFVMSSMALRNEAKVYIRRLLPTSRNVFAGLHRLQARTSAAMWMSGNISGSTVFSYNPILASFASGSASGHIECVFNNGDVSLTGELNGTSLTVSEGSDSTYDPNPATALYQVQISLKTNSTTPSPVVQLTEFKVNSL